MKKMMIAAVVLGLAAPLFAQAPEGKTETAAPAAAAPIKAEKKAAKAEKKAAKKAMKAEKKAAKKAMKAEKKAEEAPKAPAADEHAGH